MNPWDQFLSQWASTNAPFLTEEEKHYLVETQKTFTVLSVARHATKYGPRVYIRVNLDGTEKVLSLPYAEWREPLIQFLRDNAPIEARLCATEKGAYYLTKP